MSPANTQLFATIATLAPRKIPINIKQYGPVFLNTTSARYSLAHMLLKTSQMNQRRFIYEINLDKGVHRCAAEAGNIGVTFFFARNLRVER